MDIKNYTFLTFAGLSSFGSPLYTLQLLDKNEKPITEPANISLYGGSLSPNKWTIYKIPIVALTKPNNTVIGGIVMSPVTKKASPKIYFDEFVFKASGDIVPTSSVSPTLIPTASANPHITDVPKPSPVTSTPIPGTWWKPTTDKPIDWHWQLSEDFTYPRDVIANVKVYDIDGEKATADTVAKLHALGPDVKVICYFDAGVYENYRSDASSFTAHPEMIGAKDTGWDGSFWLDIRRTDILLPIMENRVKNWCQAKGFDAIEPDETEVWSNNSGFPLTKADNNTYNQLIAGLAHKYNLAVALKGNTTEAAELVSYFDFSINEQCWQYSECDNMKSFLNANKAVFNIEYNTDPDCTQANAMHMNSARRDLDLMGPTNKSYSIKLCEPYGKGNW